MKKFAALLITAIILLTCIFALVACGNKADPNDPILGWYTSHDGVLVQFSIVDGKLVYNLEDKGNNIAVKKENNEYTVNSIIFTLTTDTDEKRLTTNTYIKDNAKYFRYLTSNDKTYAEAKEIYNTASPYIINEPVYGWYYFEGDGWMLESSLMHIYIHNGRIAFSYNNETKINYIKYNYPSTQYEECIVYEGNTTTILYDSDYNGSVALHVTYSLSTAGRTLNYRYVTTADQTYDEASALI